MNACSGKAGHTVQYSYFNSSAVMVVKRYKGQNKPSLKLVVTGEVFQFTHFSRKTTK